MGDREARRAARRTGPGDWSRLRIGAACASLALHVGGLAWTVALTPTIPWEGSGVSWPEVTFAVPSLGEGEDAPPDTASGPLPDVVPPDPPGDGLATPEAGAPLDLATSGIAPPEPDGKAGVHETAAAEAQPLPSQPVGNAPHSSVSSPEADRARLTWEKRLHAHLNRFKRHPGGAFHASGAVTLTFTLAASGHLVSAAVARSSGEPALDRAALGMMARADPVPRPPEAMIRGGLTFTLPVTFRARRAGP